MSIVEDVIQRRSDGRPKSAEAFGAFAEQLQKLGLGYFRLWWNQTTAEMKRADPVLSPLSALVLAAAIVEASLTFVVQHAKDRGLGVFGSKTFTEEPNTWRIRDLVGSADKGGESAIFDRRLRDQAEQLIQTRQRIHAARMLKEYPALKFPAGIPDLRPEEAREAKAVAERVVRQILDWLERYPPA